MNAKNSGLFPIHNFLLPCLLCILNGCLFCQYYVPRFQERSSNESRGIIRLVNYYNRKIFLPPLYTYIKKQNYSKKISRVVSQGVKEFTLLLTIELGFLFLYSMHYQIYINKKNILPKKIFF